MARTEFSTNGLPLHHDGMVVVKLRSSMGRFAPAGAIPAAMAETPALSAMTALERRGTIRKVTPLARPRQVFAPSITAHMGVAATFGSIAKEAEDRGRKAGTCMVELESDEDTDNLIRSLASDPDVDFASRVPVRYLVAQAGDHVARSQGVAPAAIPPATPMWNLERIRWREARGLDNFQNADEIKVAVLDTGLDPEHPDLAGRINKYVYSSPEITAPSGPQDLIGHGTHVTGTICADFDNAFGVKGVCNCKLMSWKIFDDKPDLQRGFFGPGKYVYFVNPIMYLRALADCLDEGVQVINLSIGGEGRPDPIEQDLFDRLLAAGVTIVAAMGNERQRGSPTSYPAAIPGVIAVGATNVDERVAGFSNGGQHISLSAPGVGIWSTLPTYPGQSGFDAVVGPNGTIMPGLPRPREINYGAWDGTSMASPHVAAAAALLLAKRRSLSGSEVREWLEKTADRVPDMLGEDFHPDFGAGRLNLLSLLTKEE